MPKQLKPKTLTRYPDAGPFFTKPADEDTTGPSAPTIAATALDSSSIRITLTADATDTSGIARYRLERSLDGSTGWATISSNATFPYTDSGLPASATRYYRAVAVDASPAQNVGDYSSVVNATTQAVGGAFDGPAELPRFLTSWDTSYAFPTGNLWTATNTASPNAAGTGTGLRTGCGFQYALDNCALGDVIELAAGAVYSMPFPNVFTLKNKGAGTNWVYIVSSARNSLPPPGTRVSAADAANMPKIEHGWTNIGSFEGCIEADYGAHHYRFVGIELRPIRQAGTGNKWVLAKIGLPESGYATTLANLPHNIIFDRCYAHGYSDQSLAAAFRLHGNYMALLDCSIVDIYGNNEAKCLNVVNGYGPFRIRNNDLSATGICILFGGGTPAITNLLPADIEIQDNYFFWDPAWEAGLTINGSGVSQKNHLEFKTAERVLVERNRFRYCWASTQQGQAIYATNGDENSPTWSATRDLTVRYNQARDVGVGFQTADNSWLAPLQPVTRISVHDNLFRMNESVFAGFRTDQGATNVVIDHNTFICEATGNYRGIFLTSTSAMPTLTYTNNIVIAEDPIFGANGEGNNAATFFDTGYLSGATYQRNMLVAKNQASSASYPADNIKLFSSSYPANVTNVSFVNYAAGNFRLAADSPGKAAGLDGADIGANIDLVAV